MNYKLETLTHACGQKKSSYGSGFSRNVQNVKLEEIFRLVFRLNQGMKSILKKRFFDFIGIIAPHTHTRISIDYHWLIVYFPGFFYLGRGEAIQIRKLMICSDFFVVSGVRLEMKEGGKFLGSNIKFDLGWFCFVLFF